MGWDFTTLRGKTSHENIALTLYPELECSPCLDNFYDCEGRAQVEIYFNYIQMHHPEWVRADAVHISWYVSSGPLECPVVFESAPFESRPYGDHADFLSHYTWPRDSETGRYLDWYQLPVANNRFPKFAEALGWTPSALQSTFPLGSILRSRAQQYTAFKD